LTLRSSTWLFLIALLTACGPSAGNSGLPSPAPSASPAGINPAPGSSPTPLPVPGAGYSGPWAVMVHQRGLSEPYVIQLVALDGHALHAVHALSRSDKTYFTTVAGPGSPPDMTSANYLMPEISVSSTRVYFLDGDADVKSLAPSGAVKLVTHLEIGAKSNAVFAVSPDDRRIAVAVITYKQSFTPPTVSLRIYVQDVVGSGNRVEIFTSTSLVEWPVGWRDGKLVLAVGQPGVFVAPNPYAATEYHLVDPASGKRLAVLKCVFGPLVAAGSACWNSPSLGREDWSGAITSYKVDSRGAVNGLQQTYIALSPDGRLIATAVTSALSGGLDTELFRDGSESLLASGVAPLGWLDGNHLMAVSPSGLSIVDVTNGALTTVVGLTPIPQQGWPSFYQALPASFG
jgi:hypothetical protein